MPNNATERSNAPVEEEPPSPATLLVVVSSLAGATAAALGRPRAERMAAHMADTLAAGAIDPDATPDQQEASRRAIKVFERLLPIMLTPP